MKKRLIVSFLMILLAVLMCAPASFAASKTKKGTVYYDAIKSGSTAYVSTAKGIYKVNLKTEEVNLLKGLPGDGTTFDTMKLYKGYLYYITEKDLLYELCRVNVKTGAVKKLASAKEYCIDFVISKSKIYYTMTNEDNKVVKRVMKLNGKSKKKTKIKAVNKTASDNSKDISLIIDDSEIDYDTCTGNYIYTLKTPTKMIHITIATFDQYHGI